MRIIVTGSRNWIAADRLWWELYAAAAKRKDHRLYIVHGGCSSGADAMAHVWCENNPLYGLNGIPVIEEVQRAAWERQGTPAGMWRNRRMVDAGADLCLAFIAPCIKPGCYIPEPHGSHGASHCAEYAESRGVTTRRFSP